MQFEVGKVLSRAIQITLSKFVPLVTIALMIYGPVIVLMALVTAGGGTETVAIAPGQEMTIPRTNFAAQGFVTILAILAQFIVTAALTYAVFQSLRRREIQVSDSIKEGFKRALPVLAVSILVGLCIGLGAMLFVVPGLILMCVLYVAVPAVVVERPGVIGAMSRSAELTKGNRWSIFVLVLVFMGLGLLIQLLFGSLALSGFIGMIIVQLITMVLSLFGSVSQVVAYHDLRTAKEGISTDEIAAVFD